MKWAVRMFFFFLSLLLIASCSGNATNNASPAQTNTVEVQEPTPIPTPNVDGFHILQFSDPRVSVDGPCDFPRPTLQSIPIATSTMSIPHGKVIVVEHSKPILGGAMPNPVRGYLNTFVVANKSYKPVYLQEYYALTTPDKVGSIIAGLITASMKQDCTSDPPNSYDESLKAIYDTYKSSFPEKFVVS